MVLLLQQNGDIKSRLKAIVLPAGFLLENLSAHFKVNADGGDLRRCIFNCALNFMVFMGSKRGLGCNGAAESGVFRGTE